jgi:hypothetical protein
MRNARLCQNTVVKLLADVGAGCTAYQDKTLPNLPCKRIQCDEIWSLSNLCAKLAFGNVASDVTVGYGNHRELRGTGAHCDCRRALIPEAAAILEAGA